jgi:putative peptide zinc metalloprotease protein
MDKSTLNQLIPKRLPQTESSHIKTKWGNEYYVLHNPDADGYLRIDSENYHIWELMDGKRSIMDIIIEYHNKFKTYPLDRVVNLISQLYANSLIESQSKKSVEHKKLGFEYKLGQLARNAFQKEYAFKNADRFLDIVYRYIGRFFFMRAPLVCFGLVSIVGFALFIYWEPSPIFQFLDLRGDYDLGLVVIFISYPLFIFIHELAHAMACKYYRRKVRKAGIMFYFGMPAFFVDSTDMWLEERPLARAVVAFAGPAINIILGGLFCVIVAVIPWNDFALALYQSAYLSFFMALVNLNPLLEYDGYYILMEWLEVPNLRKESLNYIFSKFTNKAKKESSSLRKQNIYRIYGLLSIIFTAFMIGAVLYIWKNELGKMIAKLFTGDEIVAAILLGGLTLVAGSFLATGLIARVILWFKALITKLQ